MKIKRADVPAGVKPIERFGCPKCGRTVVRYAGEPERDGDDRCAYCRNGFRIQSVHLDMRFDQAMK